MISKSEYRFPEKKFMLSNKSQRDGESKKEVTKLYALGYERERD
jgi:hypothetical protein